MEGGWSRSPLETKDEKLNMSASDVYRELPYHLPRGVSQDGVPLVVASFDESIASLSPANEDDETQMQESSGANWDKTQNLESVDPPRQQTRDDTEDVSDAETHIFSDDDMELTQIIADDDIDGCDVSVNRQESLHRACHDSRNVETEGTVLLLSPSGPGGVGSTAVVKGDSIANYDATQHIFEPSAEVPSSGNAELLFLVHHDKQDIGANSIASSTTTLSSMPAAPVSTCDNDLEPSGVTYVPQSLHKSAVDSIVRETPSSTTGVVTTSTSTPLHSLPREPVFETESSSMSIDQATADPLPTAMYLHRREKDTPSAMEFHSPVEKLPVVAASFDFDEQSESSQSQSASKKRPFAYLDHDHSQSQQDSQASPPDLHRLAATTLHAAMHVQGYTSPWTRQLEDLDQKGAKMSFVTPPKPPRSSRSTPMTTSSPLASETRNVKRKAPAKDHSPIPPRTAYATRVKCFTDLHFYLSGFQDVASGQLVSQITSYGGKIVKDISQMKKVQDRCYVVATAEASRRPKTLYAMACGIPIVHPDWLAACFQSRVLVDVTGYWIPSGFSWITRRSIVHIPRQQQTIFHGLRFGIPYDTPNKKRKEYQRSIASIMKFPLEHCGAVFVKMNIARKAIEDGTVDILLTNEITPLCELAQDHSIPSVRFLWVNECLIHQKLVDTSEPNLVPDTYGSNGTLNSRVMEVILPTEASGCA
ncbi:hypothetical protein, variant [Aphanomyces invadans]|uniref:BRCT domain-containing protein n=1 Tax=Aphanomyces invadans TaxID=157072 RepID=A0A024UX57_9STRA|nr:hypothetical protein, variant [Aphanomyces invadans]ETW10560.1 hypothetical protein, variant [Aphanomyces invadans]|eukprot:XP_008861971.1 hypothetical protein, variant [Aphanomyces invadans]